jgi:streptogramin lyase
MRNRNEVLERLRLRNGGKRGGSVAAILLSALFVLCAMGARASAETANQGLGPAATVPAWAHGRSIHFIPRFHVPAAGKPQALTQLPGPGLHNEAGTGCLKYNELAECVKHYEPWLERIQRGPNGEGGEVQHEPTLYIIYWGREWNTEPVEYGATLRDYIVGTLGALAHNYGNGTYQGILHQYNDGSGQISTHVQVAAEYVDTRVEAPTGVEKTKILTEINEAITANNWPAPNHNAQYIVLAARHATFQTAFARESGCGFHGIINEGSYKGEEPSPQGVFGFVPYQGAGQFNEGEYTCVEDAPEPHTSQQWVEDSRRETSAKLTHEYSEGATDPSFKQIRAWENHEGYEIGDMCQGNGGAVDPGGEYFQWFELLWGNREAHERGVNEGCVVKDEPAPTSPAPSVTTETATGVQEVQATLHGAVNPNGSETHYYFQYGTTTAYGSYAPVSPPGAYAGLGEGVVPESATVVLDPGSVYHYRIVASSWAGTTYGGDSSFTTPEAESVSSRSTIHDQATGKLWAFYQGATNRVCEWHWTVSGWGNYCLNTDTMAKNTVPTAMRDVVSGNQWVFFQNSSGRICEDHYTISGWGEYCLNSDTVAQNTSPSIVRDPTTGNMWVVFQNSSGRICEDHYTISGWGEYCLNSDIVARNTSPTVIRDPGTGNMWVFFHNSSGRICEDHYTISGWGEYCLNSDTVAPSTSPNAMRDPTTGNMWVFFHNSSGRICEDHYTISGWGEYCLNSDTVAQNTSPSIMRDPVSGNQNVFFQNSSGRVCEDHYTISGWGEYCLSSDAVAQNISPTAMRDPVVGNQWVFFENSSGNLCEDHYTVSGWGEYCFTGEPPATPEAEAETSASWATNEPLTKERTAYFADREGPRVCYWDFNHEWNANCLVGEKVAAGASLVAVNKLTPTERTVYFIGNEGGGGRRVCYWEYNGGWGPTCLAGATVSEGTGLAAVNEPDSSQKLVYFVTGGSLCYWDYNGTWTESCLGGGTVEPGTGLAAANERLVYFVTGGRLCYWAYGTAWSENCLGGGTVEQGTGLAAVNVPSTGEKLVYFVTEGKICYWDYNGTWNESCLGSAGTVSPGTGLAAANVTATGEKMIYFVTEGKVCYWDYNGTWSESCLGGGTVEPGTNLAAVNEPATGEKLVYFVTGGRVCYWAYGTAWSENCLGSGEYVTPEAPASTAAPVISLSVPEQGVAETATTGSWTNSPTSYAYQWERCNASGAECSNISGATSASYKPVEADVEHTLVVKVTATNNGASSSAMSAATSKVKPVGQISEYGVPTGSKPYGIAAGPDGNLWFTDTGTGKIGKITTGGTITEYASENNEPEGITAGPDGNLWFVEHTLRHVAHMTTAGALTEYVLTRTGTYNVGIAAGPDEKLWFTESETSYIGKITTNDEVAGEYALPSGSKPYGITVGSDRNLWFTNFGTGKIGKITTAGTITEYNLPSGSEPYGIASGPDGNLWFTNYGTSKIGKITTAGTVSEYALPSGSSPNAIALGPDGNLWFTDYGTSKIGRITTSGTVTEYALTGGSAPHGIAAGSDNGMWFTDYGTNKIGRIIP